MGRGVGWGVGRGGERESDDEDIKREKVKIMERRWRPVKAGKSWEVHSNGGKSWRGRTWGRSGNFPHFLGVASGRIKTTAKSEKEGGRLE